VEVVSIDFAPLATEEAEVELLIAAMMNNVVEESEENFMLMF
jgi:hypothetical protein